MLKNLFAKIKSQKSSTIKNDDKDQNFTKSKNDFSLSSLNMDSETLQKIGHALKSQSIDQQSILPNKITKIRYFSNSQIPQIFTQVLSCPISYYNYLPHSKRKVKQIDLNTHSFPQYLQFMKPLLSKQLPKFNHILINHYPKGVGIMPHFDGPMYKDRVVVLSLGGPVIISFQEGYSKQKQCGKILLQDNSVHIFEEDAYNKYLHGIEDNRFDSFTFRIVKDNNNNFSDDLQLKPILKPKIQQSKQAQNQSFFVTQCSIDNIDKTKSIISLIQKHLHYLVFNASVGQQQKFCIQFNQNQGTHTLKGSFVFINEDSEQNIGNIGFKGNSIQLSNNNSFKWKVEIQRQERISITIRQKYSMEQKM